MSTKVKSPSQILAEIQEGVENQIIHDPEDKMECASESYPRGSWYQKKLEKDAEELEKEKEEEHERKQEEVINDHRNYAPGTIYQQCREVERYATKGLPMEDIIVLMTISEEHPAFTGLYNKKSKKTVYFYQRGRSKFKLKMMNIIEEQIKPDSQTGQVANPGLVNTLVKAVFVKDFNPTIAEARQLSDEGISEGNLQVHDPILVEKKQWEKENGKPTRLIQEKEGDPGSKGSPTETN